MRPYQCHIHGELRKQLPQEMLSDLLNELLLSMDGVVAQSKSDTLLKINRLSLVNIEGKLMPIKLAFIRGSNFDSFVLTVPKPLWDNTSPCHDCHQVGWSDMDRLAICETCHGLGFIETHENAGSL